MRAVCELNAGDIEDAGTTINGEVSLGINRVESIWLGNGKSALSTVVEVNYEVVMREV